MADKTLTQLYADNPIDSAALVAGTNVTFEVSGDFGAGTVSGATQILDLKEAVKPSLEEVLGKGNALGPTQIIDFQPIGGVNPLIRFPTSSFTPTDPVNIAGWLNFQNADSGNTVRIPFYV